MKAAVADDDSRFQVDPFWTPRLVNERYSVGTHYCLGLWT